MHQTKPSHPYELVKSIKVDHWSRTWSPTSVLTWKRDQLNPGKPEELTISGQLICLACQEPHPFSYTYALSRYAYAGPEYVLYDSDAGYTCPACHTVHQRAERLQLQANDKLNVEVNELQDLTQEVFDLMNYSKKRQALVGTDYAEHGYQLIRYQSQLSVDSHTLDLVCSDMEVSRVLSQVIGEKGKGRKWVGGHSGTDGTWETCSASGVFVDLYSNHFVVTVHGESGRNGLNLTGLRNYLDNLLKTAKFIAYDRSTPLSHVDVYERLRQRYPGIEQLSKCGYYPLIHEVISSDGRKDAYNVSAAEKLFHPGTNPSMILGYPKAILKRLKEERIFEALNSALDAKAIHLAEPFTPQFFAKLTQDVTLQHVLNSKHEILNLISYGYHLTDLVDYCQRLWLTQALTPREVFILLRDYVRMAKDLEVPYEEYPRHLRVVHDVMTRNVTYKKDEIVAKRFSQVVEAHNGLAYRPKGEDFFMTLPQTPEDLVKEGERLHHCVASYIGQMANNQACILFLRQSKCPDAPYITVEWKEGRVLQVKGKHNRPLSEFPEAEKFFKKWLKHVNQIQVQTLSA